MRVTIDGAPEEIAALVLAAQGRHVEGAPIKFSGSLENLANILQKKLPAIDDKAP